MRQDMGKVITERPRAGGGIKTPKGYNREMQRLSEDELPKREKIRLKWQRDYTGKQFTDVLGPLRRYVLSQIGRPFAKVFSEISEVLKPTGLSGSHAQDHLWGMLETKVKIIDGKPYHAVAPFVPIEPRGENYWIAYVDPRDGIIKRAARPKREHRKEEKPYVWVGDDCYYLKDGIWYHLTTAPVKYVKETFKSPYTGMTWTADRPIRHYDVLHRSHVGNFDRDYGKDVYVTAKRQLSKKEIKKLKLRAS